MSATFPPSPSEPPTPVPRRGRTAWRVLASIAVVLGVLAGVGWVLGALANETRHVTRRFDSAVAVVDARSGSGDVVVVGDREPGTGIVVAVRYTDGLLGGRHSERVAGSVLHLRADCPWLFSVRCDVRIEVHAPPSVDLILATDNGQVRVRDVTGSAQLSSDNGELRVEGLAGDLRASTANGDVRAAGLRSASVVTHTDNGDVTLDLAAAPTRLSATSDNGDLQVRLPRRRNVAYALRTRTDNGTVTTPIRTDPRSDRTIEATSDNGDITIRYAG